MSRISPPVGFAFVSGSRFLRILFEYTSLLQSINLYVPFSTVVEVTPCKRLSDMGEANQACRVRCDHQPPCVDNYFQICTVWRKARPRLIRSPPGGYSALSSAYEDGCM